MENEYQQFFQVFSRVSRAIHTGQNTKEIIETIVSNITEILKAKGCIFWIVDKGQGRIRNMISHGFAYRNLVDVDYQTLVKIFGSGEQGPVFIEDGMNDPRLPNLDKIGKKRVGSITGLFFDIVGDLDGILAVYFTNNRYLSMSEMEIIQALGEQGAIALQKNFSFDEKLLSTLHQMVEGFALALEAKDEQTHGHSVQVAQYAKHVARALGLTENQQETVYHGGLLHDIGKIGMNDDILQRLGILNRKEMDIVKQHPIVGAKITKPLVFLSGVEPLIRHHHERYDGSGYPDGLKGETIPLGARILTVCDAFETMIAGRNHFAKMKLEDAVVNLQMGAGNHFDPKIVMALFDVLEESPDIVSASESFTSCIQIHKRNLQRRLQSMTASMFI